MTVKKTFATIESKSEAHRTFISRWKSSQALIKATRTVTNLCFGEEDHHTFFLLLFSQLETSPGVNGTATGIS
jgi:hypothetical protein